MWLKRGRKQLELSTATAESTAENCRPAGTRADRLCGDVGQRRLRGAGQAGIAEAGEAGDAHRLADVKQDAFVAFGRLDVAAVGGGLEVPAGAARQHET